MHGGEGGVGGGLTGELSKHMHSNAKGAEKKAKKSLYVLSVPSFFFALRRSGKAINLFSNVDLCSGLEFEKFSTVCVVFGMVASRCVWSPATIGVDVEVQKSIGGSYRTWQSRAVEPQ